MKIVNIEGENLYIFEQLEKTHFQRCNLIELL